MVTFPETQAFSSTKEEILQWEICSLVLPTKRQSPISLFAKICAAASPAGNEAGGLYAPFSKEKQWLDRI